LSCFFLFLFCFTCTIEFIAKRRKSVDEAKIAKDSCPQFFEDSILIEQQLLASKEENIHNLILLMKYKDDINLLHAERTVYLKASLKMFQRGIIELELQVFLGIHTILGIQE
jgi:hypothetical protein